VLIDDMTANVAGARSAGWNGIIFGESTDLPAELASLGVKIEPGDTR
jgi:FMN phosphatase YigB (HAD superfamily)